MSGNLENDRSVTAGKMYPIDLAQKITIVKSVSNTEVKMAHLIPGQPKTSAAGQIITHTGPMGMMRPAAILSPSVSSQPQVIVSGSPLLQGTQIVSQGSQIIGPNSQILSQSQIIGPSGQLLSPGTQIISQGTQLSAQVSNANSGSNNATVPSTVSGQVLSMGGLASSGQGLVSGAGNLVVSSSVRTLPPSVRVLPPLTHHSNRPVHVNVNVSSGSGVLVSKGVSSHVPRGLAAGASLAVRPVTPASSLPTQGSWSGATRGRGALVYGARAPRASPPRAPRASPPRAGPPAATAAPAHSAIVTLPATTVLTSSGVITGSLRSAPPAPRPAPAPAPAPPASAPAARPLPLLQRNYQPSKVIGGTGAGAVGNSAPAQLYYEVPRAPHPHSHPHPHPAHPSLTAHPTLQGHQTQHQGLQTTIQTHQTTIGHQTIIQGHQTTIQSHQPHQLTSQAHPISNQAHQLASQAHAMTNQASLQHPAQHQMLAQPLTSLPRPLTPYAHSQATQVSVVTAPAQLSDGRGAGTAASAIVPRPTILRKREPDGCELGAYGRSGAAWEGVPRAVGGVGGGGGGGGGGSGSGGSTTMSAASSPAPEPEPARPHDRDASPRKKPRKQMLSNEVRQCQEFQTEETPPSPPPVVNAPPKRPQLSSTYVCGWRSTALHFQRPSDVRKREPRAKDILQIANQKHVLTSAEGWKVHHLTAQMDDLVSLEADVGTQLNGILKTLEGAGSRALTALQPHTHNLLELIKGNIQRSKIVCEGVQEAREDILRVFTHRNFVSDILTRQADKRCFRKHRSQS